MKADIQKLSEELSDKNPIKRLKAIKELAKAANEVNDKERIVKLLEPLAQDKAPFVRWNLAIYLGKIGDKSAISALDKLVTDEHANVRMRAALALSLTGDEECVDVLKKLENDGYNIANSFPVRFFVAMALGKIGSESGLSILERYADDTDPLVRWQTAVAVGDIGSPKGLLVLKRLSEDEVPFTRAHVAIALAQIGDKSGIEILEKLTKDSMPRVAQIAKESLETLQQT